MRLRNKIYFVAITTAYFVAVLFALVVAASAQQTSDRGVEQETAIGPGQHDTNLTFIQPWIVDDQVVGSMAAYVYSDVATKRPVDYWELYDDYWELYDNDGDLVAVGWFDKFGIQRTAIDRGIVEDEDKLEGIFVVVLDGELL